MRLDRAVKRLSWSAKSSLRRGLLLVVVAGSALARLAAAAPATVGSPQVVARCGAAKQTPADTRPALEFFVEDGWPSVEFAVRRTRDGVHVLAREPRVIGADGRAWVIAETSWEDLRRVDVGTPFAARFAGEHLLSLSEALALCQDRIRVCLDSIAADPEALAKEIEKAGMASQVVVTDQSAALRRIAAVSGGRIACMARWRPEDAEIPAAKLAAVARAERWTAVAMAAGDFRPGLGRALRDAGVEVQVNCRGQADTSKTWERLQAAEVDRVGTDLPEEFLAHSVWRGVRKRPVRFSLHRGAGRYAPENTLPAFEKAIRLGADFVEFDVRGTRDGQFFLLHDGRLDRTTDGTGPISEASAEAVAGLSAGVKFGRPYRDLRVPTLEGLLRNLRGKVDLYFDAKAIPPSVLAEALERQGLIERTVVYQNPGYLRQLRDLNPRIRLLPPLRAAADLDGLARDLHPYGVDVDWDLLSADLIGRCHALGVQVFSDALDEHEREEDFRQAIGWGIDVIQTDHPVRLLRAVARIFPPPR